jgi:hypothetical protein
MRPLTQDEDYQREARELREQQDRDEELEREQDERYGLQGPDDWDWRLP